MSLVKNIIFYLFLLLPTFIFIASLEIIYRGYLYYQDVTLYQQKETIGEIGNIDPTIKLRLKNIIKWNDNPLILYDLIPSIRGIFKGKSISINDLGFRGLVIKPKSGRLRIVGIGDSVMFGWGVADSEMYINTLVDDLKTSGCIPEVDIINSAVPGYNTVMAVATLHEKLLYFKPNIVIYHYVMNDLNLPAFIRKKNPIFSLEYSFFFRMIKQKLKNNATTDYRLGHPPNHVLHRDFLGEENNIPAEYQHLMGLPAFTQAIKKLAYLAEKHSFLPIVLTNFSLPKKISKVFNKYNITILDTAPLATKYLHKFGHKKYLGSPLTVSDNDRHPSAIYHRIISSYLAQKISDTNQCH